MAFIEKFGLQNPLDSLGVNQLSFSLSNILNYDYNGDGSLDRLVVATDGSLQYFRNDGSGTYTQLKEKANPFAAINVGTGGRIAFDSGNLVVAAANGSVRYFERLNQSVNNTPPPSIADSFTTLQGTAFTTSGGWTNENLYSRKLADVNGDGRADIVGFGNGNVVVSLGKQDGTFANAITVFNDSFTTAHGWNETEYARRLADVNGDGRADIVGFGANGVYVALGQSNGGFGNMSAALNGEFVYNTTWTDENITSRYVADVNGDGRADIVGFAGSNVHVALGQRNGTFSSMLTALAGGAFTASYGWNNESRYARRLADVNGDGRADIVGFYEDRIDVSLGQSNGTFAAPLTGMSGGDFTASQGWTDDNVFSRHLEDINGDGRADIIGFGSGAITAALGKADGTFDTTFVLDNSGAFTNTRGWTDESRNARRVADVDGDGVADIVGFYTDRVHVGLNEFVAPQTSPLREAIHANGNFASTFFTTSGGWTNENIYARKLADVNGDGLADIVGFGNGSVIVAQGQSDGTFGTAVTVLNDSFTNSHGWNETDYARRLADVNGDGRADIVGFARNGVYVALGQNNGGFGSMSAALSGEFSYNSTWTDENIHSRYVADVNGDGRADIVGFGNSDVYAALGQRNGTFSSRFTALAGGAFTASYGWNDESRYARRVADVNGDGRADIVGFYENRIDVSLGQRDGTFAAPLTGLSGSDFTASAGWTDENLYSRHLEDINGDGRADIVGFGNGAIVAALGKADGTFDTTFVLDDSGAFTNTDGWTNESRQARRVADVNGDGIADIVGFGADSVQVSLNQLLTKVDALSANISDPGVRALSATAFNMSTLIQNQSQNSSFSLNQRGGAMTVASNAAYMLGSTLAVAAAQSAPRLASAFYTAGSTAGGWGVFIAAEIISEVLARNGYNDAAGYLGSGNEEKLVNLYEESGWNDYQSQYQSNLPAVIPASVEAGLAVPQAAINFASGIYNSFFKSFVDSANDNLSIRWNDGYTWQRKTNGGVEENGYLGITGTAAADVLQGAFYADGGAGDDVILGRISSSDDAYLEFVSRINNSIYFVGGTSHYHGRVRLAGGGYRLLASYTLDGLFRSFDNTGITSTQGWRNFRSRYGAELGMYFDGSGGKTAFDKLGTIGAHDRLSGGAGDDKIFSQYASYIDGGDGSDYIRTTHYSIDVDGGTGDDYIVLDANATPHSTKTNWDHNKFRMGYGVDGGTGNDHLVLNGLHDIDTGSATKQDVFIWDNQVVYRVHDSQGFLRNSKSMTINNIEKITVIGTDADNQITVNPSATMTASINGEGGNDILTGSAAGGLLDGGTGNDSLIGHDGTDVLIGGQGLDTLTGGGGADIFVINANDGHTDVITDFNQADGDTLIIDTSGYGFGRVFESDLANFRIGSSNSGSDIYYGNNKLATINGSDGSDLHVGQNVLFTEYWETASI